MSNNYSHYKTQDFLEDSDFIDYLLTSDTHKSAFWEQILQENLHLKEAFDEAKAIFKAIKYKNIQPRLGSKEKIWNSIQANTVINHSQNPKKTKLWPYLLSAAASLALILYFTLLRTDVVIESSLLAQTKIVRLPDSSFVTLNAGSEISYDNLSYNSNRKLKLKGEAFFQVKKGSSFIVTTDIGEVRVLGTSFNIYSRKNIMSVLCFTGKVGVKFNYSEKDYILTHGMEIKSENHSISSSTIEVEDFKSWRDGYFYYENAPLSQVMEELQRQYELKELQYSNNLLNYRYTGFFKKDKISDALQSVFIPLKLRAEVNNGILSVKE
ncbi:MAG: FecR domain-containing protein [Saprospiraceae bacterium]